MYCSSCGKKITEHSKFCKYCGASQVEIEGRGKKKVNKKNDKYVWSCDFCGKEFETKKESDKHELSCIKNPNKKKFNLSFGRLFSRAFFTGVLSIIFFLIMMPFLIKADNLPFDDKAEIGGVNMWRIVIFYGLFTTIFCLFAFLKNTFVWLQFSYYLLGCRHFICSIS